MFASIFKLSTGIMHLSTRLTCIVIIIDRQDTHAIYNVNKSSYSSVQLCFIRKHLFNDMRVRIYLSSQSSFEEHAIILKRASGIFLIIQLTILINLVIDNPCNSKIIMIFNGSLKTIRIINCIVLLNINDLRQAMLGRVQFTNYTFN